LYFSRDYTPHDHRFLSALAETEHEVFYLRLERRGHETEDRVLPGSVQIVPWAGGQATMSLRDGLRLLFDMKRVLRRVQPDLIHAGPIQSAGLLAALSGFHPLVVMSWGSDLLLDAHKNGIYKWVTSYVLERCDVFLADCDAVKQQALAFGVPEGRTITFPWGVDLGHFSPGDGGGLRERAGWGDAFVLLHTRSWEPLYGVDVMAKAFVHAAQQRPELRLFMLGNGSMAAELRRIFMQGGVLERVRFVGQISQNDLPRYYRAADLYISASRSDGSSVSLMEALACGLPALVSDIPGNREWVTPGKEGWWFPDGDADALAQGILDAVDRKKDLKAMGAAARKLAEKRANWRQNVKQLQRAYELAGAQG
jgi:glycosyltransferase involved in cell wall biosynthesis